MNDHVQTGIVALSSIDDYLNDVCKKHELTVEVKERDRINHVDITSAQTGPIFLTYKAKNEIRRKVNKIKQSKSLYDFISEDHIRHRVWIVSDKEDISYLQKAFDQVESTYIADGHHRAARGEKNILIIAVMKNLIIFYRFYFLMMN